MACLDGLLGNTPRVAEKATQTSEATESTSVERKVSNIRERLQEDLKKFGNYYTKYVPSLEGFPPGTFYLCKSKCENIILLRYMTDVKTTNLWRIKIQEDGLSVEGSLNKFKKLKHLLKYYKDTSKNKGLVSKYTRVRDLKIGEKRANIKEDPAFKKGVEEIKYAAKLTLEKEQSGKYIIFQNRDRENEFTLLVKMYKTEKMPNDIRLDEKNIGEIKIQIEGAGIVGELGNNKYLYRSFDELISALRQVYRNNFAYSLSPYKGELCESKSARAAAATSYEEMDPKPKKSNQTDYASLL
ncbi:MAG: hypothetical protein KR126chlam6_01174 [Candidatus Anoxychlamydiales bacterium]|nr:hypothetical protein [Candidatus Anoxychlamydiales bacterium]